MIGDFVEEAPGMELAGTARDGEHAQSQIELLDPDIVTLDVQMPRMDGLAALDAILKRKPLPVIMVSSLCQRAAEVTLQALDRGALDYVAKPDGIAQAETVLRRELIHKIRTMAGADVLQMLRVRKSQQRRREVRQANASPNLKAQSQRFQGCCIALGISRVGRRHCPGCSRHWNRRSRRSSLSSICRRSSPVRSHGVWIPSRRSTSRKPKPVTFCNPTTPTSPPERNTCTSAGAARMSASKFETKNRSAVISRPSMS